MASNTDPVEELMQRYRMSTQFAKDFRNIIDQERVKAADDAVSGKILEYMDGRNPADNMHFLGILAFLYVMEPTNATEFATTVKGFNRNGKVLGDMVIEVKLLSTKQSEGDR